MTAERAVDERLLVIGPDRPDEGTREPSRKRDDLLEWNLGHHHRLSEGVASNLGHSPGGEIGRRRT